MSRKICPNAIRLNTEIKTRLIDTIRDKSACFLYETDAKKIFAIIIDRMNAGIVKMKKLGASLSLPHERLLKSGISGGNFVYRKMEVIVSISKTIAVKITAYLMPLSARINDKLTLINLYS